MPSALSSRGISRASAALATSLRSSASAALLRANSPGSCRAARWRPRARWATITASRNRPTGSLSGSCTSQPSREASGRGIRRSPRLSMAGAARSRSGDPASSRRQRSRPTTVSRVSTSGRCSFSGLRAAGTVRALGFRSASATRAAESRRAEGLIKLRQKRKCSSTPSLLSSRATETASFRSPTRNAEALSRAGGSRGSHWVPAQLAPACWFSQVSRALPGLMRSATAGAWTQRRQPPSSRASRERPGREGASTPLQLAGSSTAKAVRSRRSFSSRWRRLARGAGGRP